MNPYLKYGAFLFAIFAFLDFFTALSAGSEGNWSVLWFEVSHNTYLGFKLVSGIILIAYGFGIGQNESEDQKETTGST